MGLSYLVHCLCVAVQVSDILSQHFQRPSEGTPCHSVRTVSMARSDYVWSSLMHGAMDQKASGIRWLAHVSYN